MVYNICNRIIYRGFHPCCDGKTTITKPDGQEVKGKWLTGQLVEVPIETPAGSAPKLPILCLVPSGQKFFPSRRNVCPGTIAQFSGTMLNQEWDSITQAKKNAWLKEHSSKDWKGEPVFEGDIFQHRLSKEYLVVTFDLQQGFRLENLKTCEVQQYWFFDLLAQKGSLWAPPKQVPTELILRQHKRRNAENRVAAILLD